MMPESIRTVSICGTELKIKNYHCIECGDLFAPHPSSLYYEKAEAKLRLYVHVTDKCNASCAFCRRKEEAVCLSEVNPDYFYKTLKAVAPHIYSVAFTGGEPMLFPELTDELIGIAAELLDPDAEIDLVSNGTNLDKLPLLKNIDRLSSLHLSRHHMDDNINRMLFNSSVPDSALIAGIMNELKDPAKLVLNCVLQSGSVDSSDAVADYLVFSAGLGIRNNSFITMFIANEYCREHYVSPYSVSIISDSGCRKWNRANPGRMFSVWNRHRDHDFCSCLSGSYESSAGLTRYYFRCPGEAGRPEYCRQLVYTADNLLTAGFGGKIIFNPDSDD